MPDHPDRPWWAEFVPDIRAWATAGMFVLVFYILHLLAAHPELARNEMFKTAATLLLGSGAFGLVCAFLWGGSKASTGAVETVNQIARNAPPQPPPVAAPVPAPVTDPPAAAP